MLIDKTKKIMLFANCKPVCGYLNAIICDLQRGAIYKIDKEFYKILTEYKDKTIADILSTYDDQYEEDIISFISQILNLDLAMLTNNKEEFPELSLEWDSAAIVENMIIEYSRNLKANLEELIQDLVLLGVKHIELRFYSVEDVNDLEYLLDEFQKTKIRGVYLVLPDTGIVDIIELSKKYQRISQILVTNVNAQRLDTYNNVSRIWAIDKVIKDNSNCGQVGRSFFCSNVRMFTESQNFNTCLNKKLSITSEGDYKNCPSMNETFGNIITTRLSEVINHKELKNLWGINKDEIEVCKDCEYRYVCTDCRAFRKDSENIYSKPLKCGYDPYTGEWADWNMNELIDRV